MAFQQTNASDVYGLLAAVRSFATGRGWSVVYDNVGAGELGLSKGSCHIAFGEVETSTPTDHVEGGTVNERVLHFALSTGLLSGGSTALADQPGVDACFGDDYPRLNDVYGPFPNIWLYSSAAGDHIHVVAQSAAERYIHLSFGHVDLLGQTVPATAYCSGQYHHWWPDDSSPILRTLNNCEDFESGFFHAEMEIGGFYIPAGVLDASFSWDFSPPVILPFATVQEKYKEKLMQFGNDEAEHLKASPSLRTHVLDYFLTVQNQPTTGGVALHPLYAILLNSDRDSDVIAQYLGDFPEVRLVNISDLNPGQEITYGAETWQVFPVHQKGEQKHLITGDEPLWICNTWHYGLAYKKTT